MRNRVVTVFERPTAVEFHHPMRLNFGLGVLDITLGYRLTPGLSSTQVHRECRLTLPAHLKPFKPVFVRAFRGGSTRTLHALKAYADGLG